MPDVIVIGGGIVGTSAAAFLAEAGASVTLLDRDGLASGASGANSGVVQHPMDPPMVELFRETVGHYRTLTDADAGFRLPDEPAGMLFVSHERAAAEGMLGMFPGLATEVLAGDELRRIEPTLAPDLAAMRVAIGYPVPPSASTYAYATVAERRGVTIRVGRVATPVVDAGRVVGVRVDGRVVGADQVLVAAGPWTPAAIDPSGTWVPIRERWGVVVEVELAEPPSHCIEEAEIGASIGAEPSAYERGGPDTWDFSLMTALGVSAVGSTFLRAKPDPDAWTERLLQRAASFVPAVMDAPIRGVRACARPVSTDGRPLIGAIPGTDGLFVCAGHGPWGISTGPASARLVVDTMLGRKGSIPTVFDPGRFGPVPV